MRRSDRAVAPFVAQCDGFVIVRGRSSGIHVEWKALQTLYSRVRPVVAGNWATDLLAGSGLTENRPASPRLTRGSRAATAGVHPPPVVLLMMSGPEPAEVCTGGPTIGGVGVVPVDFVSCEVDTNAGGRL